MSTNGRGPSHLEDFVIISGLSGAGKSSAMNVFEDAGYFCVDNLPAEMIRSLAELFRHSGSKVERAAVVSDSRGGEYLSALAGVIDELDEAEIVHRVLFLEADEQTLLNRYKETRRRHPLAPHGSVVDGIQAERELLGAGARAGRLVHRHQRAERERAAAQGRRRAARARRTPGRLAVTFTSFGHKHGPPRDADLALDVRFLPEPALRGRTCARSPGSTSGSSTTSVATAGCEEFYDHVLPLLEYLLPQYVSEGKAHLVVAIGCTGGRHRSVAIAEHLAAAFRGRGEYFVEVQHRDVDRVAVRGG